MKNKNSNKNLTKATIAVMAIGGIATVVQPAETYAAPKFTDVLESSPHYEHIIELQKRGVISGYQDGTFKPNANVTRGQAAKMLAVTLGIDTSNVNNPKFKDLQTSNVYYPYVAALAEQGVINGFVDGTFRPDEVITRGDMAKIIMKGFNFKEASTLNHSFKDVSDTHYSSYAIQTLVNLGVTKGTSVVTFGTHLPVTRAQMASFLVRSENVEISTNGETSTVETTFEKKEITGVEVENGTLYIYLDKVKHTVNPKLKNVLNIKNAEMLKGATIESEVSGTTINTLEKITFNSSGSSSKPLKFDGNGSTFAGSIDIKGNHLNFSNWKVSGAITIKTADRKTLGDRTDENLNFGPVDPLGVDFINWNEPTLDEIEIEPNLTPENPNKPVILATMENVAHNIKLNDVTMLSLVIESDKARIASNNVLESVTVRGYASEFELLADVTELYIESHQNVTFYGVSDVKKLYKNVGRNLNLFADSVTELLVVENDDKLIDLGEFYTINKVIVPEFTQAFDIFGDFLRDNSRVKYIENIKGKQVDPDIIENTITIDEDAPELSIENITTNNTAGVMITFKSNEKGRIYYMVKNKDAKKPNTQEVLQYAGSMGGFKTSFKDENIKANISNLEEKYDYVLYVVAVDETGNKTKVLSKEFNLKNLAAISGETLTTTFSEVVENSNQTEFENLGSVESTTADENLSTLAIKTLEAENTTSTSLNAEGFITFE